MNLKKFYYYIICLAALFVLMWGMVDLAAASLGAVTGRTPTPMAEKETEASIDLYYQKKILYDRLTDSLARIIVSGLIFAYSRAKAEKLEG